MSPAESASRNSCDRPLLLPQGKDKDLLFFLTEQHQFSVLEYDTSTGEKELFLTSSGLHYRLASHTEDSCS